MTKLDRLKKEALEDATCRGHRVGKWIHFGLGLTGAYAMTVCTTCGRQVVVQPNPLPNGIEISGEAVALGCKL